MNCTTCNKSIPDGAVYCPFCGRKQSKDHKPKHRANGTGTAYRRRGQKTWTAEVTTGWRDLPPLDLDNPDNKRQRIPVKKSKGGFKTRAEALSYCEQLKKREPIEQTTLMEVYTKWEPWYKPRVDKDTFGCYRAAFAYFKPLHGKPIRTITAGNLQQCMDDCPRGHRTHQNMKVTAGLLWAYAIDHNITEKDVTRNLYIGKGQSVQREPLSDIEVERIRQQIGKELYAGYIYALCYLGYRPGEMLEIKKEQVTEHNGVLYIVEGKKTDAGRDRIVPVHKKIEAIIRAQMQTEGTDMLFPMHKLNRKGEFLYYKPMTDNYFNKYAFRPLADKLGIPGNKVPYSARHTFSDKLKDADGTDKTKAALIGHKSYEFTKKAYQSTDLDELNQTMASIK